MFYFFLSLAGMLIVSISAFLQYSIVSEETNIAIKTKNILTSLEKIERTKYNEEKKTGTLLTSIYDLDLPISNLMIKEKYNNEDLNYVNFLKKKIDIFLNNFPLETITCNNLNSAGLLSIEEYNNCNTFNSKNINFFQDSNKGIRYTILDDKINDKLLTFNTINDQNNKIIKTKTYQYDDLYKKNIFFSNIFSIMNNYLNNKDYIHYINLLPYLYYYDNNVYYDNLNNLTNKIILNEIILSNEETQQLLLKMIPTLLNKYNEKIIDINNYNNIKTFLNDHKTDITNIGNLLNYSDPNLIYNNIIN